jgi:tetratricopeptide (TPR) repeat protein
VPPSPLQHAQHLAAARRLAEAERACRQALAARPDDPQTLRLLAQLTRQTGKAPESVRHFQRLRQMRPNDRQLQGELGASLVAAGQAAAALGPLNDAVQAMPAVAKWHAWLGRCLTDLGRPGSAIPVLRTALALDPDDEAAHFHLADALRLAGHLRQAEASARAHHALRPDHPAGAALLADILLLQGRYEEATVLYQSVLDRQPAFLPARAGLSRCLRDLGRYEEALGVIRPLLDAEPDAEAVLAITSVYSALKRHAESRDLLDKQLENQAAPAQTRSALYFRLGATLDALRDHDGAFHAYARANELAVRRFDRESRAAFYDGVRRLFTPEFLRDAPRAAVDGARCAFIVGMPRSGTTLLEQALDAHPAIFGAGELDEAPESARALARQAGIPTLECLAGLTQDQLDQAGRAYLRRIASLAPDDRTTVIDKLPHNFAWLGYIWRILPGAKIIHITRNPLDTCVSCFATDLSMRHGYSNSLADTGWEYGQYQRLMRHWRDRCGLPMVEVRYEDLIADLEGQTRRVLEFLGLPWDDRCLRFHESTRAVATASVEQVRQPLYNASVGRWRHYAAHLAPLIESLRAEGVDLPGLTPDAARADPGVRQE